MAYKTIIGTMKTAGTLDISAGDIDLAAGSVDNADLAGSIANSKLVNDSVTVTAGNGLSGGGEVDLGASVSVALDLNELSAAAVAVGADSIAIIDADDNSSKKESIADLVTAMAGDECDACMIIHGELGADFGDSGRYPVSASFYTNSFLHRGGGIYDLTALATLFDSDGGGHANAVSYTHLTLPTIYSV